MSVRGPSTVGTTSMSPKHTRIVVELKKLSPRMATRVLPELGPEEGNISLTMQASGCISLSVPGDGDVEACLLESDECN